MASVGPIEVTVPGPPDAAFTAFTEELGQWWPQPYSWGPVTIADHRVEPHEGGRVTEVSAEGMELDWAIVTGWDPPARLQLSWAIGPDRVPTPDPARRSTVTVTFAEDARGGTRVTVVHDRLESHGGDGVAYARGMASPQGWPWILELFSQHLT